MKIVCVSGGGYKSFYLNYYVNLSKCDLLVFNYGILYDYQTKKENDNAILINELRSLSSKLNCIVIAGVYVKKNKRRYKSILVTDNKTTTVYNAKEGAKISIGGTNFIIGDNNTNYQNCNKIVLSKNRIKPNLIACSKHKIYIFCDEYGVNFVFNKKIERKFYKYSKIILK